MRRPKFFSIAMIIVTVVATLTSGSFAGDLRQTTPTQKQKMEIQKPPVSTVITAFTCTKKVWYTQLQVGVPPTGLVWYAQYSAGDSSTGSSTGPYVPPTGTTPSQPPGGTAPGGPLPPMGGGGWVGGTTTPPTSQTVSRDYGIDITVKNVGATKNYKVFGSVSGITKNMACSLPSGVLNQFSLDPGKTAFHSLNCGSEGGLQTSGVATATGSAYVQSSDGKKFMCTGDSNAALKVPNF